VSRLENRDLLCPTHLERVAKVLGVDPEGLLDEVEIEAVPA
jgi:hypothetical protein